MKVVQLCTKSILFSLWHLSGHTRSAWQPHWAFLRDLTPLWHMCLLTLEQWLCRQSRREKAREGGLFSSTRTSSAAAFTRSKAHERGSRPPPALFAPLTPASIPLVSEQAVDFITVVFFFLQCVECAYFPCKCEMCCTAWHMLRGYVLAVLRCRLRCKIHTHCCQGILSKYELNKISSSTMALSCLCAVSAGWFRGAIS